MGGLGLAETTNVKPSNAKGLLPSITGRTIKLLTVSLLCLMDFDSTLAICLRLVKTVTSAFLISFQPTAVALKNRFVTASLLSFP